MRPKRWIDPSEDTNVQEGDLRIVRTKCGQVRAAIWQQNHTGGPFYYCDSKGDGYDVVAVGVTWERKRPYAIYLAGNIQTLHETFADALDWYRKHYAHRPGANMRNVERSDVDTNGLTEDEQDLALEAVSP